MDLCLGSCGDTVYCELILMIRVAGFTVVIYSLEKVNKSDPSQMFIQSYYYLPTLIASFEDSDLVPQAQFMIV